MVKTPRTVRYTPEVTLGVHWYCPQGFVGLGTWRYIGLSDKQMVLYRKITQES